MIRCCNLILTQQCSYYVNLEFLFYNLWHLNLFVGWNVIITRRWENILRVNTSMFWVFTKIEKLNVRVLLVYSIFRRTTVGPVGPIGARWCTRLLHGAHTTAPWSSLVHTTAPQSTLVHAVCQDSPWAQVHTPRSKDVRQEFILDLKVQSDICWCGH